MTIIASKISNRIPSYWDENKFTVGNKELDFQHRTIFNLIDELETHQEMIDDAERVNELINSLIEYSKYHLSYEEYLLEVKGYSQLSSHKELHWDYIAKVSDFSIAATYQDKNQLKGILDFLRAWWNDHILVEDMKYKHVF